MRTVRRIALAILLAFTFVSTIMARTDAYKLSGVKRVDQDLYRSGNIYIQTRYCYHYTYGEDAILKWSGFSGKIIWDDNSSCDVEKIFRK